MGHVIQTKQASRASGGPQYYLHDLEPLTAGFIERLVDAAIDAVTSDDQVWAGFGEDAVEALGQVRARKLPAGVSLFAQA